MKARGYILLSVLALGASGLRGQIIATGNTFSVASSSGSVLVGNHFHNSSLPGSYFPAGRADVGRLGPEEERGLSEFDLNSLLWSGSGPVFLTFDVFLAGGQFRPGDPPLGLAFNDFPFIGTVAVNAYAGNNAEDISDYQIMPRASVGTFSTANLRAGETVSLEVTNPLQSALMDHLSSLGFRLQEQPLLREDSGAWTFNNFRLTLQDETFVVPEPASYAWSGLLLLTIAALRRRKLERVRKI